MKNLKKQIMKMLKKGNYKNIEFMAECKKDGVKKGWQKYKVIGMRIIIQLN